MAKPMQELGKSPLRGVHASAPFDGWKFFLVRERGNLRSFILGAMIAPQVILIERNEVFANWYIGQGPAANQRYSSSPLR